MKRILPMKWFIPISIVAGLLALIAGKYGLKLAEFSDDLASYPGLLIPFLFGVIPFTFERGSVSTATYCREAIQIAGYITFGLLAQWGLGLVFSAMVFTIDLDGIKLGVWIGFGYGFLWRAWYGSGYYQFLYRSSTVVRNWDPCHDKCDRWNICKYRWRHIMGAMGY